MGPRSAVLVGADVWSYYDALCWVGRGRMRTSQRDPSVELPMGPRSAVLGGADACDRRQWGL
eukprot:4313696-Pyramimonas_sp.AAC.1